MADGELFAAMRDVGLAEFVAKGLDKKHRKALPALDISGMTAAKAKVREDFGGKKIFELWCASQPVSASMGIFERHLRHFQAVLGGSRA